MRTVSTVITAIEAALSIITSFVFAINYSLLLRILISAGFYVAITPIFMWILFVVGLIIKGGLFAYREHALDDDEKIAAGVVTLIFLGFIGGICTLCIPQEELDKQFEPKNKQTPVNFEEQSKPFEKQTIDSTEILNLRLSRLEKMRESGRISDKEYTELKKKLIDDFKFD